MVGGKVAGGYAMISPQAAVSRRGKRRLIWEGGFATRISNNVRPQDLGGGGVQHGSQPPGRSGGVVWLQLVAGSGCAVIGVRGHTVACSCRLVIVYKYRAVVESDSLVIEPLTGPLLLYVTLLLNFVCVD